MEERLKKIEEKIVEHEQRIQALEKLDIKKEEPANVAARDKPVVQFDENKRPFFNVLLPSVSRQEIQKISILLLMYAKRDSEPEMTSKNVSSLLHKAGVDVRRIKDAYRSLRNNKPSLITSKSGKRTITLTNHGEQKAIEWSKKLERK
jgi:predicted transcriptional regulator